MSLISNAVKLQARLLNLPRRAGLVQYSHSVKVIQSRIVEGQITPVERTILIQPNPKVQPIPARLVGTILSNDIVLSEKDLLITNIVLSYSEQDLQGEWEIDGHRGYRLIQLIPETTTYKAIVSAPYDVAFSGNFAK
jgi:hypothetical protein